MCFQNKREAAYVIRKMYVQNKRVATFSLLIISIILLKCFYYKLYKNFRQGFFLNGCFLIYLATHIKLLRTATF